MKSIKSKVLKTSTQNYQEELITTITRLQGKGTAGKIFLKSEVIAPQRENGISHFQVITSKLGGAILLLPIRESQLAEKLDEAKRKLAQSDAKVM